MHLMQYIESTDLEIFQGENIDQKREKKFEI